MSQQESDLRPGKGRRRRHYCERRETTNKSGDSSCEKVEEKETNEKTEEEEDVDNSANRRGMKNRHFSWGSAMQASKDSFDNCDLTPSQKKSVRFADSLGLDLFSVKLIHEDQIHSNYVLISSSPTNQNVSLVRPKILKALFKQPCFESDFLDSVNRLNVRLETAMAEPDCLSIRGLVRVKNIEYHKAVYVRWTIDDWRSMSDFRASYVPGSSQGWTDQFEFRIYAPVDVGQQLVFAIRYHCAGQQFWDNNKGDNYAFICQESWH